MLMLFVQDSLEDSETDQLKRISECKLLKDVFKVMVSNFAIFEVANQELA